MFRWELAGGKTMSLWGGGGWSKRLIMKRNLEIQLDQKYILYIYIFQYLPIWTPKCSEDKLGEHLDVNWTHHLESQKINICVWNDVFFFRLAFEFTLYFHLCRQHPFVLPHQLIPYVVEKQLFKIPSNRQLKRYWQHMRGGDVDLGNISPDNTHIPLWLWADEAQCTEQSSIMVVAMGSILDSRKYSLDFCFPLTFCRVDLWIKLICLYVDPGSTLPSYIRVKVHQLEWPNGSTYLVFLASLDSKLEEIRCEICKASGSQIIKKTHMHLRRK